MPEPTFLERVPSILEAHEPLKGCKCHMLEPGHYLLAVDPALSYGPGTVLVAARRALVTPVKTEIPRTGAYTAGNAIVNPIGWGGMFRTTTITQTRVMVDGGPLVHNYTYQPDPEMMTYFDQKRYFPAEIQKILNADQNDPVNNMHYYYLRVKEL